MKNRRKKIAAVCAAVIVALLAAMPIGAARVQASESSSYTYTQSVNKEWIRTQDAYMPGKILLNDGTLHTPEDMFIYENKIYIADTGVTAEADAESKDEKQAAEGGRIVVYDMDTGAVTSFGEEFLQRPMGIFVNEEAVFIADRGAEKVYKVSHQGQILMELGRPDSYLFSDQSQYLPTGVAVSSQGVIFVVGEGAFEGLMQFDKNGIFQGYFAANATKMTFSDRLRELVFNEAQMEQLLNRIPNPIYNIDISERDLVYSITQLEASTLWTVASQTENAVKYHNMAGMDILSKDLISGEHNFTDIAAYKDGLSLAVTSTGIIYEYDETGNVIFSFGGLATTERSGHFVNAVAIDIDDKGNLYVLDKEGGYFQMFFPTDFANATHQALYNLSQGSYSESERTWLELLRLNGMSYIAHQGYAKVLYQQTRFEEAAEEFRIIKDQASYSECMWEIRNEWFQKNLPYLLVIFILLLAAGTIKKILQKKGVIQKRPPMKNQYVTFFKRHWSYMKNMLRHPVDELYDLKKKKHGSVVSATVLFVLAFVIYLLDMLARSFTFRMVDTDQTSLLSVAVLFIVPAALWVIGNYMVSAISEGEGSFRSVYVSTAYALVPYVIIGPIVIVLTYVMTLNEAVILHYLWTIGIVWSAALLCMAVREIHNYTVKETVKIILLTLFFMIMAVIVSVILFLIGQQVVVFFQDIIEEVAYHA